MTYNVRYNYRVSSNVRDLGLLEELKGQLDAVFVRDEDSFDTALLKSDFLPSDAYDRVEASVNKLGLVMSWETKTLDPVGDVAQKIILVSIHEPVVEDDDDEGELNA
jgi:hypothetical protein